MHKEMLKSMESGKGTQQAFAMLLVFLLIFIVGFSNFIYNRFGVVYISYVAFVSYIIIGVYVYRKKILDYRYSLIDDELIFEEVVGKRQKHIISVDLGNVIYFCPLSHESQYRGKVDKNLHILFRKHMPEAYVLVAKQEGKVFRVVFKPSSELVELIKRHL